jgi:hypothetical protein
MATASAERFKKWVLDPSRSRDEIEQMMRNAVAKGETELARIAKDALDARFPGWDAVRTRAGGPRPAECFFRSLTKRFPTSKEAYVWLLERFIGVKPRLFEDINWETVFVAKGRKRSAA